MEQGYSEAFKNIIKGKIEGVDYIVIGEREPRVWHDGESDSPYEMDFTQKEMEARKNDADIIVGSNGGLSGAFDPNTHTMIITARSDMIDVYDYKFTGLYIPFSDQKHEPADPMKAAALNYQAELAKREREDEYGRNWMHYDHSDEVAFLKAVLPTLNTEQDRAKVTHLIEENARYTVTSNGHKKGRNDEHPFMRVGQQFIIPLREALDKKELQTLALNHMKWQEALAARKTRG